MCTLFVFYYYLYYNCIIVLYTPALLLLWPNYVEAFLKTWSQLCKNLGSDFVSQQVIVVINLYGLL